MAVLLLSGARRTDDLEVLCRPCNALDYVERVFPEIAGLFSVSWREPAVLPAMS